MEDEEKNGLPEIDVEMDSEKKLRRSSILKPQKARNPLSTLDFSEANPDTTLAKAPRRVSFASSNFIKQFAADAETNTIWDSTYEEDVNHTDSTKSSCDQTHATKTSEFLNMTSIHSVTGLCQNETATATSVSAECSDNVVKSQIGNINPGESLVSIARKLRSKSVEQQVKDDTMDFTLTNKTVEMGNVSVFNKTSSVSCSTTKFPETKDITLCVDKENVNPLINDVSLALPRRNCSISSSTTKCFTEETDFTKPIEKMENTVHFGACDNNLDFTGLDATGTHCTISSITKKRESVMEFTCIVSEEINGTVDIVNVETQECKSRRKTIHFNETEGNVDLTMVDNAPFIEANEIIIESKNDKTESDLKRKTILFNQSDDDMEFTSTLPINTDSNAKVITLQNSESLKQVEKIPPNDYNELTELTDTFSNQKRSVNVTRGILKNPSGLQQQHVASSKSERTICFNESEGEMEFTNVFSIKKDTVDLTDLRRRMSINMDCTKNVVHDIYSCVDTTSDCLAENMELTTVCPTKTIIENFVVESKKDKTVFDCDMELTTNFSVKENKLEQCDSSLIQNNYSVNLEVPLSVINDEDKENTILADTEIGSYLKEVPDCIGRINITQTDLTIPTVANNSRHADVENIQRTSALADECVEHENPVLTVQKRSVDIKRHLNVSIDDDIKKRRKIEQLLPQEKTPKIYFNKHSNTDSLQKENSYGTIDSNDIQSDPNTNTDHTYIANTKFSYMEMMKVDVSDSEKRKTPKICNEHSSSNIVQKGNPYDPKKVSTNINHTDIPNTKFPYMKSIKVDISGMEKRKTLKICTDEHSNSDILQKGNSYLAMNSNEIQSDSKEVFTNINHTDISKTKFTNSEPIKVGIDEIEKRNIQQLFPHEKTPKIYIDEHLNTDIVQKENLYSTIDSNEIRSNSNKVLTNTPHLETVKVKSAVPDLFANLDINCAMNFDHASTPATSFHINLSPQTLRILDNKTNADTYILYPDNTASKLLENSVENAEFVEKNIEVKKFEENIPEIINEKTFSKEKFKTEDACLEKIGMDYHEIGLNDEKSYFLADTTPLLLAPDEFDHSNPEVESPNQTVEADQGRSLKNNSDTSGSYKGDYTLRSELVLTNIEKHLLVYEPIPPSGTVNMSKLSRQFNENSSIIKELCKQTNIRVVDLEEIHRQYLEESASTDKDACESVEGDLKPSPVLGFIAQKTLYERIREMSKSCKTYWDLIKVEDNYYFFSTLFETLPFQVHVHPELGTVYSVTAYSNLSEIAPPICHYELKNFMQKLKLEHLLSVLGSKFDIITLLDYVYMSIEEMIDFHKEYLSLVKKYGRSHQFTMNPDFSITFKILNVKLIIAWVITIKLPAASLLTITKEDVTAVQMVGQTVNVEHIRGIVENTPKGPNFLRKFIENVDDYVTRISRRLRR